MASCCIFGYFGNGDRPTPRRGSMDLLLSGRFQLQARKFAPSRRCLILRKWQCEVLDRSCRCPRPAAAGRNSETSICPGYGQVWSPCSINQARHETDRDAAIQDFPGFFYRQNVFKYALTMRRACSNPFGRLMCVCFALGQPALRHFVPCAAAGLAAAALT